MGWRLNRTSGSLSVAIGLVGAGAVVVWPDQRWIGWVLIAVGLLTFAFDVRLESGRLRVGSAPLDKMGLDKPSTGARLTFGLLAHRFFAWRMYPLATIAAMIMAFYLGVWRQYENSKPLPDQLESQRVYADVGPAALFQIYESHTSAAADQIFGLFRGKWLRASGSIADISSQNGFMGNASMLLRQGDFRMIYCYFDGGEAQSILTLPQNKNIAVVGRIYQASGTLITLTHCHAKL